MADEKPRSIDDRPADEIAKTLDEYPDDLHKDPDDMPSAAAAAALSQWRVGKSVLRLRDQIDAKFPGRRTDSDGTIGDTAHCPGTSDHCPNISDGGVGVVTGMDITHDPTHGLVSGDVADTLRLSHDPRISTSYQMAESPMFRPWAGNLHLPGAHTAARTRIPSTFIFQLSPGRPAPAVTTPRLTG